MTQPARQRFDFVDYVQLEEVARVRHEFLDGFVWAMAGGSPEHAAVAVNVSTQLNVQLAGRSCRVFSSDLRVRVTKTGLATYPDVTVVCGSVELDAEDPKGQTVVNPKAIVEVLSPSTEEYDREEKLSHYKQVPSLEAVVLVAHDRRALDLWFRAGDQWAHREVTSGSVVLPGIDCTLELDAVYADPLGDG